MPTSMADLVARVVECDKPPELKAALLQVAALVGRTQEYLSVPTEWTCLCQRHSEFSKVGPSLTRMTMHGGWGSTLQMASRSNQMTRQ